MAATWRSSAQTVVTSATCTLTTPGDAVSGDILVVYLSHDGAGGTFSAPDGTWTSLGQELDPVPAHLYGGFYKVLSAAPDATYAFTASSGSAVFCGTMDVINPDGQTLSSVAQSITGADSGTGALTTTAVTGAADPTVLICAWSADDGVALTSGPASMTVSQLANGGALMLTSYYQVNAGTGSITKTLTWNSPTQMGAMAADFIFAAAGDTAALTGTAASGQTEQRMRTGGNTIIGTLTGDTWTATFDSTVQDALTAGLDSAQAEAGGWNATVRDAAVNPITWVRTSDTVATGTLTAVSGFQITATETVTWTIAASTLTGGVAIVAAPTFTITRGAMDLVQPVGVTNASGVPATSSGSLTGDVAQLTRVTCTIDGVTLDTVRVVTTR